MGRNREGRGSGSSMGCQRGQWVQGEEKILSIGAGMGGNGGVKLMVSLGTSLGGGGVVRRRGAVGKKLICTIISQKDKASVHVGGCSPRAPA